MLARNTDVLGLQYLSIIVDPDQPTIVVTEEVYILINDTSII